MRVLLPGQIQASIGRVETRLAVLPVSLPGDAHFPEDCGQGPLVAGLDAGAFHPSGIHHLQAGLAVSPQIQMILEKAADQLAALGRQRRLQITMGHHESVVGFHETEYRFELFLGVGKWQWRSHRQADHFPRRAAARVRNVATPAAAAASSLALAA